MFTLGPSGLDKLDLEKCSVVLVKDISRYRSRADALFPRIFWYMKITLYTKLKQEKSLYL